MSAWTGALMRLSSPKEKSLILTKLNNIIMQAGHAPIAGTTSSALNNFSQKETN